MTKVDAAAQTDLALLPNPWVSRHAAQAVPHRQAWLKQASDAGQTSQVLSLQGCSTKAQVYQQLAKALPLPKRFGRNLDALYDCLADTDDLLAPDGLCLVVETAGSSGEVDADWLDDLYGVFDDAAADRADSSAAATPFRVVFVD